MRVWRRWACTFGVVWLSLGAAAWAQSNPGLRIVRPATVSELRQWDARIDSMLRSGDLQVQIAFDDPMVPGRRHERDDQYYEGVKVFGAQVVRQTAGGQTVSLFGALYADIDLDPTPGLSRDQALARIERLTGVRPGPSRMPELMVFPKPGGGYALTWRARVFAHGDLRVYFLDARTGDVVFGYSDLETQAAVGKGRGVLGDEKKISASSLGGMFVARDELRPPSIDTFDMQGDVQRTLDFLNDTVGLGTGDLASDNDNDWSDGANVDAHVYSGWVYDYYYKRFGRRGLDDRDLRMRNLVHPVHRNDLLAYSSDIVGVFFLNAFYAGYGVMVYGEGLPPGYVLAGTGQTVDYFSGALDTVAHELTHGVTDYTSQLVYLNESGALNEAFSDMMGTSVEFYYQPAGNGLEKADYLIAEDVFRPGGIRSMSNPGAFGDPDHYSKRYLGSDDNGGVHINSGIANQAYYLAIEGGTNRTSGLHVTGVGASNREQIEKVFYRAFTMLLPSYATFSMARAACEQAARDLYGSSSAAYQAMSQAWAAVGVN